MDAVTEIFRHIGNGNRDAVAAMVQQRPELARARAASSLSVLSFARYMERGELLQLLIDSGPPLDVFDAASIDRAGRVRELVTANPALVNGHSSDGFTALHFAAYFGAIDAMKALLDAGANIEAKTQNFLDNMPLHAAAAGGRVDASRLLLDRGADPNARQHGQNTALMTAAFQNSRELAELLIAHGADVDLRNDEDKTAADVAAGMGNMELAARLRAGSQAVGRHNG